ncbi:uncharacterized protein K02A2.6-like [Ochlerotatus camptorhynchus]|uniref:uncharacterized protein K02A2.6-like n=1 Tax=Ochlerotatus camptorhynchus TaxID=644619 RepID=UPI0031D0AA02
MPLHEKYVNTILPKHPRDFTLDETVTKLKKLFGRQKSVFNSRYQCLKYAKSDADDFTSYAAMVNKHCEAFQLSKLTPDQFKALRFVCGLQSPRNADIRARLISKLEADETAVNELGVATSKVTLENLVEECHRVTNLKQDTLMVENKEARNVNIVSRNQNNPASKKNQKVPKTPCWKCGDQHYVRECPFASHTCSRCKQQGHKEGYCNSNKNAPSKLFKQAKSNENVKTKSIYTVRNIGSKRKFIPIELNGVAVKLQHDSASDITIISEETWISIGQPPTQPTEESAVTASGGNLNLLAEFQTEITIKNVTKTGRIFISSSVELNVLGIETMDLFDLWSVPISSLVNVVHQRSDQFTNQLKQQFPEVFRSTLGRCTKAQVKLYLKPDARPAYCPKRPVAYAALAKVDAELERLQQNGIISPVQFSDWAAPIVVVRKSDNVSVRVEVEEESLKLLTVNTHRGLFQYNRLHPGIKSAPGAFQRIIHSMVAGIPGVKPYLNDILIAGRTKQEHDRSLYAVLEQIREYGFHLRLEKCRFALSQIKFLGHLVDKGGIRPDPSKTEAIYKMQMSPKDVQQLRSYLGAVNYYGRFVKQMKQLRAPLDSLLKKDARWNWTKDCQKSFEQLKAILLSDLLLIHYDPSKEIVVAADASKYGLGAVIMHRFPTGEVKAIAHASRSLTPAEMNYGQVEKEALALIFAVTRCHKMLYGRHFLLQTDHQPLLKVFDSKKGIPVNTANRLQRWALTLLLYDFDIQHVSSTNFGYADFLSRLMSSQHRPDEDYVIAAVCVESEAKAILDDTTSNLPVTHQMIVAETRKDPVLQQVSNGQAERFVDSLKHGFKKLAKGEGSATLEHLQTFLSVYRSIPNRKTPQSTSPAGAFLGRPVRTTLDLLKKPVPVTEAVKNHKQNEQFNWRHGAVKREFEEDDLVYVEQHRRNAKSWIPGRVIERKDSVNYIVALDINGRPKLVRSHVNQRRPRHTSDDPEQVTQQLPWEILLDEIQDEAVPLDPEVPFNQDVPIPIGSVSLKADGQVARLSHIEMQPPLLSSSSVPARKTINSDTLQR